MEAAKVVPTSILKLRPVIWLKQSAIAVPAFVILPVSPEGTKVITIGLSAEPRSPAAGAAGASASLSQTGGGRGVGVGGSAVGASVGAVVGTGVAAAPQALKTIDMMTRTASIKNERRLFIF